MRASVLVESTVTLKPFEFYWAKKQNCFADLWLIEISVSEKVEIEQLRCTLRLPHTSRFFVVELQIFCRNQFGQVKILSGHQLAAHISQLLVTYFAMSAFTRIYSHHCISKQIFINSLDFWSSTTITSILSLSLLKPCCHQYNLRYDIPY